jgi:hypothetical protein
MTSKEVAVQGEKAPAHLAGESFDSSALNLEKEDLSMSWLSVGQDMSKAVKSGEIEKGHFYDSITLDDYGTNVEVIVLHRDVSWSKFDKNGVMEGRSDDGKFWEDGTELTDDEKYKKRFQNFYVLIRQALSPVPVILSFSGIQSKNGRNFSNLINKIGQSDNLPMHSRSYIISTNYDGSNYIKHANPGTFLNKEEYEVASAAFRNINELVKRKPVETESSEEELGLD